MKLSEVIFLALVSAAVVGFCLYGWLIESYSWTVIMLPILLAAVILTFSSLRALRTLRLSPDEGEAVRLSESWHQLRDTFGGLLWCLLALPILALFGYPMGLSLFAALYVRTHGGGLLPSVIFGGVFFAVVWILAVEILGLPIALVPVWWQ